MRLRPARLCALALLLSCGTLGAAGGQPQGLPSSGVGPFRALEPGELTPKALVPYVFSNQTADYREPYVIGTSSDPSSTEVWMYAVAHVGGVDVITRTRADDARSFYGDISDTSTGAPPTPPVVLQASQPWEGGATGNLGGPSALLVGGQLWLYYAAAGGIGLAQSADGLSFTKQGAPVLTPDASATWEATTPHAPSVAIFPDGTWHMMYGAGVSIGEATSPDGITWTRVAGNPVFVPSPTVDPSTLPAGVTPPFDEGQVDDPMLAPQMTIDGQLQVRVLYTGYGAPPGTSGRASAIGFAARYGDTGALSSQPDPVYTASLHENAPGFFEWSGGSLLYVSEDNTTLSMNMPFPAIAAAYAPANDTLPSPLPFPTSP
ncbi:MAG TPA: hypothetical protein VGL81_20355 [Polyangiaceae bacterium]|jgi:hypothetical protein